jgi:hypothetical protein
MPADSNTQTNRLTDMEVREVAFVDRPANKRRFLVVKRSDAMPAGAEVTPGPDGNLTAGQPAAKDENQTPPEGTPPEGTPGEGDGNEETSTEKADLMLTADAKGVLTETVKVLMAKLEEAKAAIDGAEEVETEAEMVADPLVEMFMDCAAVLEDVSMAVVQPPPAEPPPEGDEVEDRDESAGAPATPPPPFAKRLEVIQAERVVRKAEIDKENLSFVKKVGARMSKDRVARMRTAITALSDILSEVQAVASEPSEEDAEKKAAADKKTKDAEEKAKEAEEAKKAAEAEADKLRKSLRDANAKLEKARQNVAGSGAAPVEKSEKSTKPFSWPVDMNSPMDRDSVKKGEFFGKE